MPRQPTPSPSSTRGELLRGHQAVASDIRSYIVDNFLLGEDDGFRPEDSLLESGIVDSTAVLELVSYLEQRFGVRVEDEEMSVENLDTVEAMARFVAKKQRPGDAGPDAGSGGDGQPS